MGFLKEGWKGVQRRFRSDTPRQGAPDESLGPARPGEVRPPWIEYPGLDPGDYFWREAGEPWRTLVWEPYLRSLSEGATAEYLEHWKVPDVWRQFYFGSEWRDFLDHVDDPEDE